MEYPKFLSSCQLQFFHVVDKPPLFCVYKSIVYCLFRQMLLEFYLYLYY